MIAAFSSAVIVFPLFADLSPPRTLLPRPARRRAPHPQRRAIDQNCRVPGAICCAASTARLHGEAPGIALEHGLGDPELTTGPRCVVVRLAPRSAGPGGKDGIGCLPCV